MRRGRGAPAAERRAPAAQAVEVAEQFLPAGSTIVGTEGRNGPMGGYVSSKPPVVGADTRVVVLTDCVPPRPPPVSAPAPRCTRARPQLGAPGARARGSR